MIRRTQVESGLSQVSFPRAGNSSDESQVNFPPLGNSSGESQVSFPLAGNISGENGESQLSFSLEGNSKLGGELRVGNSGFTFLWQEEVFHF